MKVEEIISGLEKFAGELERTLKFIDETTISFDSEKTSIWLFARNAIMLARAKRHSLHSELPALIAAVRDMEEVINGSIVEDCIFDCGGEAPPVKFINGQTVMHMKSYRCFSKTAWEKFMAENVATKEGAGV